MIVFVRISPLNDTQVSRPWTVELVSHGFVSDLKIVYCRPMNKTNLFSDSNLTELQDFMFDTMLPAEMCVDWFCERFNVNATDEVIDFVVDSHFAFFGN